MLDFIYQNKDRGKDQKNDRQIKVAFVGIFLIGKEITDKMFDLAVYNGGMQLSGNG
jgi:hypothetical protein